MATTVEYAQTEQQQPQSRSASWPEYLLIGILIAILYGYVLYDLGRDWWFEPSLSQGLLIPPLALFVAWSRRELTLALPVVPDWRGVLLAAVACLFYLAGKLGAEFFLPRISFVILLAALVWTFWGVQRLRTLTFPLLLLATMVPLPSILYNTISAPLQLLASDAASRIIGLSGVTVHRDGNMIHLADITLGVEEACNGLSSLSTLLVASLLLGFLLCSRPAARWLVFLAAVPVAIATNILRIAGTAWIADFRVELALGFYHLFSGWLVFLVGFTGLYAVARISNAILPGTPK